MCGAGSRFDAASPRPIALAARSIGPSSGCLRRAEPASTGQIEDAQRPGAALVGRLARAVWQMASRLVMWRIRVRVQQHLRSLHILQGNCLGDIG